MLFYRYALSVGCILVAQLGPSLCQNSSNLAHWWPFGSSNVESNDVYDRSDFKVYWNVPTKQCHQYGLNFTEVSKYGIIQNSDDRFLGEKISIFYDPGEFPAFLDKGKRRNGGLPQEGDLQRHLDVFEKELVEFLVPDPNFSGLGIIDFEHWRPTFKQNYGVMSIYVDESIKTMRWQHPWWSSAAVEEEAERVFEKAARDFMAATLKSARRLRPQGKWGYYSFPLCFNFSPHNPRAKCKPSAMKENDRLDWLYSGSGALYPSLYYKKKDMTSETRADFMTGRVVEAVRMARGSPVIPYTCLKYYDQNNEFVTKVDFHNTLKVPRKHGAAGIIIWGASRDVNTEKKCRQMLDFLETVVGPAVMQTRSLKD
ncbi:unnamed protein product [Bemisia tabaci]|uniref:Hyaluronidase n=1 Tax=Bemisia tabaci TaxID=7038 RepID=A0A9P0AJK2_BEMTA|nr:unnamed protein product [Bemisia tabaci]